MPVFKQLFPELIKNNKKNKMKILTATLLFFASFLLFISCQKELHFDTDGNSIGTLKANAGGDCLPSNVNGIYKADSSLSASNYIDVQINITTPGAYNIYSDTLNGYSFKKAGTIGATGLQTIRLYGTGKPIIGGVDIFTITYGTSSCKIAVNVAGTGTTSAVFALSGAPDTCTNFIVTGNYIAGQAVTPGEFLTLTVNVTAVGTYSLSSSNNNGLGFSGSGLFTNTGLQNVTLNAVGTPVSAGDKYFNILHAVGCTFKVIVTAANTNAVFTYAGAGGNCTGAVIAGIYTAGTALTVANTASLSVNVTQIGNYNITLPSVNGITFKAVGSFNNTGANTIVFTATGIPTTAGNSSFSAGCTFVVTVVAGSTNPPANEEYMPMTTNTNFKLEFVGGAPEDTSYVKVLANNITLGGNSYRIFQEAYDNAIQDSLFYRNNAGKYYQYHVNSFGLDNDFNKDGLLLDSNLAVNAVWMVDLGNNAAGGTPVAIKYEGKILEKNATATVGGVVYTKIIKVQITYKASISGAPYQDAIQNVIWFAKGKGIIYQKFNDVPPTTTEEVITKNIYIAP